LYYSYNKDWAQLHYFGFYASIFVINLVFQLPESPKYLFANARYDEARDVINQIAKFNGKPEVKLAFTGEEPCEEETPLVPRQSEKV